MPRHALVWNQTKTRDAIETFSIIQPHCCQDVSGASITLYPTIGLYLAITTAWLPTYSLSKKGQVEGLSLLAIHQYYSG